MLSQMTSNNALAVEIESWRTGALGLVKKMSGNGKNPKWNHWAWVIWKLFPETQSYEEWLCSQRTVWKYVWNHNVIEVQFKGHPWTTLYGQAWRETVFRQPAGRQTQIPAAGIIMGAEPPPGERPWGICREQPPVRVPGKRPAACMDVCSRAWGRWLAISSSNPMPLEDLIAKSGPLRTQNMTTTFEMFYRQPGITAHSC